MIKDYRIREFPGKVSGITWFYPEVLKVKFKTYWFRKKFKIIDEWYSMYGDATSYSSIRLFIHTKMDWAETITYENKIIAFKTLDEAQKWLSGYKARVEESRRVWLETNCKNTAIETNTKETQIHTL